MVMNYKMSGSYFKTRMGVGKIITIFLGGLCVGITAYAFDRVWKEEVFMGIISGCLVLSIIYVILYAAIEDLDLQTTNKALVSSYGSDSGFHFLAALMLLLSGSLILYSAVHLRQDTEYLCAGGIDRGIPCLYDRDEDYFGGPGAYNGHGYYGNFPDLTTVQGQSGYARLKNEFPGNEPRFFTTGTSWLDWIKNSKANFFEKCYEILPRIIWCNRYYELKITAGVIGIFNGLIYASTGIMILSSD